jgi:hypothetical protein
MPTLHIHLDESGDFTFSPKGSRFYIFTAAWTYDPVPLAARLRLLKFDLIKQGHGENLSGFHACDDPPLRRETVVNLIRDSQDWHFASIVIEKCKVNPTLYDPLSFYPKFLTSVLKFVLKGRLRGGTPLVLIYTVTLPFQKNHRMAVTTTIKASCKDQLVVPFRLLHHRVESNHWIQIADYCSWAVCRKWEFSDTKFYDLLRPRLAAPEMCLTDKGDGVAYY